MKRFFTVLLALALLLPFGATGRQIQSVHAESSDAQFVDVAPKADFPMGLTFETEITSASKIRSVELVYAAKLDNCADVYAIAYPTYEQAKQTKASWYWDMRKAGGLPIGTYLLYYWRVTDDTGHVTKSETMEYEWMNPAITWKERSNEDIQVFWEKGDTAFGQLLLNDAQTALDKNDEVFGLKPHKKYRIYVFENTETMRNNQLFESSWSGGLSFTEAGVVVVGIDPDDEQSMTWGRGAMVHELTHAIWAQNEFTCIGDFPTWLVEGTAMYVEDMVHPLGEQNTSYLDHLAANGVFSVRRMNSGFGVDPVEVNMLYTQSFYLVKLIVDSYGPEKFVAFKKLIHDGVSAEKALQDTYQLSFEQLEQKLAESLNTTSQNTQATATTRLTPTYIPTIIPIGSSEKPNTTSNEESSSSSNGYFWALLLVVGGIVVGFMWRRRVTQRGSANGHSAASAAPSDESEES
jgi:hypothetical protein